MARTSLNGLLSTLKKYGVVRYRKSKDATEIEFGSRMIVEPLPEEVPEGETLRAREKLRARREMRDPLRAALDDELGKEADPDEDEVQN